MTDLHFTLTAAKKAVMTCNNALPLFCIYLHYVVCMHMNQQMDHSITTNNKT